MPKAKENGRIKISGWLQELDKKKIFQPNERDDTQIFCKSCAKMFTCTKKNHILQHQKGLSHIANMKKPTKQLLFNAPLPDVKKDDFCMEMCNAFVAADIPLHKLKNPVLSDFLQKHCGHKIPDESTLRKKFMVRCYNETIEKIRKTIGDNEIYIMVDETTDIVGRYIANIIIGTLEDENAGVPFLLASKPLVKANNVTVSRFVNESLGILWPNGIKYEKVRLFVSDGAAYMVKCGQNLKVFYPNLIHLTCLAHGLNLVCSKVRDEYEKVDDLISNTKKIFLKAPLRTQVYREMLPDIPMPPQPVLTRWGTWLEAAFFYAENFEGVKTVVDTFDENSSKAIKKAQQLFKQSSLRNDLQYIKAHFKILKDSITKLQTGGMPLTEGIEIIENVKQHLLHAPGTVGQIANAKLRDVLTKNPGYGTVKDICDVLNGHNETNVHHNCSIFKFCPLTSCDVERSFSWLKNILNYKRTNFTPENLEMYLVCYGNAGHLNK